RHTRSDRDWSSDVCSSDLLSVMETFAALALQLHSGARGKSLHHRQRQWIRRHRLVIEGDEMADNVSVRSSQGHAEVAYRAQVNRSEERRVGKEGRAPCMR